MKKTVTSSCCNASVQHFPNGILNPMGMTIFFCNNCDKVCDVKISKEDVVDIYNK